MGPWYDIAVHMHRDDLKAAAMRRHLPAPGPARQWPAGLAALGVLIVMLAV